MNTALFETLEVQPPTVHAGITLFPVVGGATLPAPIGLAGDGIVITEKDVAEVPVLVAHNPTDSAVLLLEGEVLDGGQQTRTLNVSVLVPAGGTVELPVSCVEAGRWHGTSRFSRAGYQTSRAVRESKTRGVNRSVRRRAAKMSDQGAVWDSVDGELARFGVESATRSYAAAMRTAYVAPEQLTAEELAEIEESDRRALELDQARRGAVDELVERGPVPGQTGVVVAVDGKVVAAELFGTPELLEARWAELVRSILLDARPDEGAEVTVAAAEEFLHGVATRDTVEAPGVGLGDELHVESEDLVAQALVWDSALVHASAFASLN